MFFFLASLAQVFSLSPISCPSFTCGSTPSDICIAYDSSSNTNTVSSCASGEVCPYNSSAPGQSVSCAAAPPSLSYPGEKCRGNADCSSNNCTAAVCQGRTQGAACNHTLDCNPGLYCAGTQSKLYCQPQLVTGASGCIKSADCTNLAYCNYTGLPQTSLCIGSMTLLPGTRVSLCTNGINYLCRSLFCSTSLQGAFCTDDVTTLKTLPVRCASNRDCMSTTDPVTGSFYLGSCVCGNSQTGSGFCTLFPGDPPFLGFIATLSLWMNSPNITNCNSNRGMAPQCIQSYFSYSNILLYYMYAVQMFPMLQDNPQCVKETLTNSFWYYEEILANATVTGSGVIAVISAYALLS
jgi:hypothetical protein